MHTVDRDARGTGDTPLASAQYAVHAVHAATPAGTPTHESDHLQASEQFQRLTRLFETGPAAILTGAGISTDSGIPDYRGTGSPPRTPMNIEQFTNDVRYRSRFWAGARIGALRIANVRANAGHEAVAALEQSGHLTGVITQNVDSLHQRAGSENVIELHGSLFTTRCTRCSNHVLDDHAVHGEPPACPRCGSPMRPGVVWFGEMLPADLLLRAQALSQECDVTLVVGTSAVVQPVTWQSSWPPR